ncbi:MAG TPA: enoyl-CoA hydratase/isomerase family protein [Trebonia sp.]|nr:enoyl-CoA hydratase/isomerase family protein [Trebonia sp.]
MDVAAGTAGKGATAVRVARHETHVELTLGAAERGNPLDDALVTQLIAALDEAAADPRCRAALISAEGPHFCRGLDLGRLPPQWLEQATLPPWRAFTRLREAPLVTVALVDGQATGGGVALAAACDLVATGRDASFRFTELLLGLVPGMAFPFVADRVGPHQAWGMALRAHPVGPDEALRTGLADLAYPAARDGAREILAMLRRITPDTVRAAKRLRDDLYPRPAGMAETACRATAERLRDPDVRARIAGFRAAGALS